MSPQATAEPGEEVLNERSPAPYGAGRSEFRNLTPIPVGVKSNVIAFEGKNIIKYK